MTTQAAQADIIFRREGVNKKVNRVKGEAPAVNVALLKAERLRKETNPLKAKKKSKPLMGGNKKVVSKDICILARKRAIVMPADVPLVQSLDIVV